MSRPRRPNQHHTFGVRENTWTDPRTKIVMAPGAIRNWPTMQEEETIKYLTTIVAVEAKQEVERQRKLMASMTS